MSKLANYGIRLSGQNWIASYLGNREQVTKVGQAISDKRSVVCGVPQGSILGPLLFTIYINDLPDIITPFKSNLYADDTAISINCFNEKDLESQLSDVIRKVSPWFQYNRLSMNCTKAQFMVFSTKQKCSEIKLEYVMHGNVKIHRESAVKYLGIKLE